VHYGWARLRGLNAPRLFSIVSNFVPEVYLSVSSGIEILDWAYESRPNMAIADGDRPPPPPLPARAIVVSDGSAALDLDLDHRPDLLFVVTNGDLSIHLLNDTRIAAHFEWTLGTHIGPETTFSAPAMRLLNLRTCGECGCFGWPSTDGYLGVRLRKAWVDPLRLDSDRGAIR